MAALVQGARLPLSQEGIAMAEAGDVVMKLQEVAAYLKIARSIAYKLAQEGRIPGQKVGRHWRFHRDAIDRWLANEPGVIKKK